MSESYTALATYLVKPDKVEEFAGLLREHWPKLREHGLATDTPAEVWYGTDASGPFFIEILTWVDPSAPGRAYWHPEIARIWNLLYKYTEGRDGRPGVEYPTVQRQSFFDATPDPRLRLPAPRPKFGLLSLLGGLFARPKAKSTA